MTTLRAWPAADDIHLLADGPVWDDEHWRLLWVDVEAGDVLTGELAAGRVRTTSRTHVDTTVGAVVPGANGRLLVAARETLTVLDRDGTATPLCRLLPTGSGRRLNDGACDPAGRFLVGTVDVATAEGAPLGPDGGTETLQRLEDDGTLTTLDGDLMLSNGIAWSPNGRVLYSTDTLAGVVHARDYDPATGATGPRRDLLQVDPGWPDGLRVDAAGNLWVAVWDRGQVQCYSTDGELLHVIDVPAPLTSGVAFAGPGLGTLVITTASVGLTPEQLARHRSSGRLFVVDVGGELGVRGLPATPWRGLTGDGSPAGV